MGKWFKPKERTQLIEKPKGSLEHPLEKDPNLFKKTFQDSTEKKKKKDFLIKYPNVACAASPPT